MSGRLTDWVLGLTTKSTTIDGTEKEFLISSGLPQQATLKDKVSYALRDLAQTWNNPSIAFNGIKLNVTDTASSASSMLMDLQIGGVSRLRVNKSGWLYATAIVGVESGANVGYIQTRTVGNGARLDSQAGWNATGFCVNGALYFTDDVNPAAFKAGWYRDADNIIGQRNSTNAQESRVYATYTDATNYQRCSIKTGKTTLSNVSGATVTATGLIPAGALLIGVTSRVNTACTTATGYTVGTAGDPDLWGVASTVSAGTATGSANFTAAGASGLFTAATDVIVTATGGNFDGTGVIELAVHYLLTEAD